MIPAISRAADSIPAIPVVKPAPAGPFKLPPLPYAVDALEPHFDAMTMTIHHDRHHASYVGNLNRAIENNKELHTKSVEELLLGLKSLPAAIQTAVQNQGGGHANHSLFWQLLGKPTGNGPRGELAKAIEAKFHNQSTLEDELTRAGMAIFGSGWAWLSLDEKKQLKVETTPNQNSPLLAGHQPLFGIDVWEHAYYLKYQNKRAEYIGAYFKLLNWDFVSDRYSKFVKA